MCIGLNSQNELIQKSTIKDLENLQNTADFQNLPIFKDFQNFYVFQDFQNAQEIFSDHRYGQYMPHLPSSKSIDDQEKLGNPVRTKSMSQVGL